jgi:hypothetical protein
MMRNLLTSSFVCSFIFYYGTTFFKRSGISDPFLISVATNVVNVGMTIPGILAVDRVGRRTLASLFCLHVLTHTLIGWFRILNLVVSCSGGRWGWSFASISSPS